jgi:hypothetical protein
MGWARAKGCKIKTAKLRARGLVIKMAKPRRRD